jgi:hypothetical protein
VTPVAKPSAVEEAQRMMRALARKMRERADTLPYPEAERDVAAAMEALADLPAIPLAKAWAREDGRADAVLTLERLVRQWKEPRYLGKPTELKNERDTIRRCIHALYATCADHDEKMRVMATVDASLLDSEKR